MPVIGGVFAKRKRAFLALEYTPKNYVEKFWHSLERLVPPRLVTDGPCKEIILKGEDVDLARLPIPIFSEKDLEVMRINEGFSMLRHKNHLKKLAVFITPAVLLILTATRQQAWPQLTTRYEKVRIAYPSRGLTILPLRIAQVKGFFREEALEAEIIQMKAGVAVTALTTGDIDYGAPLDSIVRASARGQPLKGLISFVNKPMHYLVSRTEINSVKELKGKTLAISAFGSTEQYTTYATLKAHGLDPERKDVQIVALGESPVRLEALKRAIVDATVILIPHVIVAENLGFKILANAGEFIELSTPGVGTSERNLREKPDQVKKVVRATARGLLFLRQNRGESLRIIKDWLALDEEIAGKAYDMGLMSFSEDGSPSEKGLLTSIRLAREGSAVKKDVPLSKVFELGILREILKELRR